MSAQMVKNEIASNIRRLMTESGKNRKEVCSAIGVSYTTFNDWYNGKTMPRADKIELLANYFGCKKSDLLKIEINSDTETVSFDASEIARRYEKADQMTQAMIRRLLAYETSTK